ncbi:MAG: hypothetical protein ACFCGT_14275 [Sandaracinaceae bacterium]
MRLGRLVPLPYLAILSVLAAAPALVGCGAKTGLHLPDAELPDDAGQDAGLDEGPICRPAPLPLDQRGAEVLFVIDRSNSMNNSLDGDPNPLPGEPRRWDLLADALAFALSDTNMLLAVGGAFYPTFVESPQGPEEACEVESRVDLAPARGNADRLLEVFTTTGPAGGTPTAEGLRSALRYFDRNPSVDVPRFVVLATDGGPNCNPEVVEPTGVCEVCTGEPRLCDPNVVGEFWAYNCLDEERTLAVIGDLAVDRSIPVYVIGIDDPNRADLADVLDRMAVRGGRPRDVPGERLFYSVREPEDLRGALDEITGSIALCTFTLSGAPAPEDRVEVAFGDEPVARDTTRIEGWDFTAPDRSEITLYGGACARASTGEMPAAVVACPDGTP